MKKDEGILKHIMGVIPIFIIAVVAFVMVRMEIYQASSTYIEDALAASCLASAVVDLQEYGRSNRLLTEDPREACETFGRMLKGNLSLDEEWICLNSSLISGKVDIAEYSIYEVVGNDVIWYCFPEGKKENMYIQETTDGVGTVKAADGTQITSLSVYAKICFKVKFFGKDLDVFKQKCVDVIKN